jgi:hypothetical protein
LSLVPFSRFAIFALFVCPILSMPTPNDSESRLLNPTVIGVIIGSSLTFFGNVLTESISSMRDARQWERENEANLAKQQIESDDRRRMQQQETFKGALAALATFSQECRRAWDKDAQTCADEISVGVMTTVSNALAKVAVESKSPDIQRDITEFLIAPDLNQVHWLRQDIVLLMSGQITEQTDDSADGTLRTVDVAVSDDFRRRKFIDGIALPKKYSLRVDLADLTTKHREQLALMFFGLGTENSIPPKISLRLPSRLYNGRPIFEKTWKVDLDAGSTPPRDIFDAWSRDVDDAVASLAASVGNSEENDHKQGAE